MTFDVIVPDKDKRLYDNWHFASTVRTADLVLCSGQIDSNDDGGVPESAEDEFRNAWNSVDHVLKAAGLDFENIIEYTSYHVNLNDHVRAFMKVRDEFLSEPWPAWTAIGITELALPGARVEIRVTATPAQ